MKRFFGILIVVLIIAALGYGGYRLYQSRQTTAAAGSAASSGTFTQLVAAQRGNLNAAITVVGELAAVQSADLPFEEMSGTAPLVTLKVDAGNTVKAGQVLATIDPAAYQQALDQAKSDLQAAEKKLADLKEPVTELDIAKADLAIAKAEYQVKQTQNALDDLLNPDLDTLQQAVADAQTSLTQAKASLVSAQTDTAAADKLAKLRDTEADRNGRTYPVGLGEVLGFVLPGPAASSLQQSDGCPGHAGHHRDPGPGQPPEGATGGAPGRAGGGRRAEGAGR